MAKKIRVTETVLRDAHQSLLATRMRIEDMLPILPKLNEVGFNSLECWGGATFDSCLRFLGEDPWERLRTLRRKMPDARLQMLFRGQNMLGYRHYADDVLEEFVQKSVENGIDVIRIFDALNDIRNLQTAINSAKKASRDGKKPEVQVAISYTTGEVFTTEYYVEYAKKIQEAGADSICIKDMAALLTPYKTEELVKALKSAVDLPIDLHTHYTSGLASMCLLKGIEAGADFIMVGHQTMSCAEDDLPSDLSGTVITDWLRGNLNYQGIVITDAHNMNTITKNYSSGDAALRAIQAGADIVLMPDDLNDAFQTVYDAVENGELSEERIDESVRRILTAKAKHNLL